MLKFPRNITLAILLTAFSAPTIAGEPLSAPFVPLSVGTVLDYGTWRCEVTKIHSFEQSCTGPEGERASFYGKFVHLGRLDGNGYGIGIINLWCA